MKKQILLLVLIMLPLKSVIAQKIQFGVKSGLNIATITGDLEGDLSSRYGFHIGIISQIPISDNLAIQPELLYSSQGVGNDFLIIEQTIKLDYINIPILLKYNLSENFSVEVGPQAGFLLSAKLDESGDEEVDIKDVVKGFDLSAGLGLSYQFDFGLNLSSRYNFGLSNINDEEGDNANVKNGVFQFSIGYLFN